MLLLFNTTRAHTPDPQAREPLSLWTEVWPTQPVLVLLLLFNTTRAHTPDPQARGPRSLWTEVCWWVWNFGWL